MPSIETLFAFSLAAFLLSASPGPSNLYIMARSLNQGFASGLAAAGGMALGSLIYVVMTAFGLAAIFAYSPLAFTLLKIAGAIYLIYLGVAYLSSKPVATDPTSAAKTKNHLKVFYQSIVVELTNPKTALFFMAFLPQFVDAQQGNVTSQFMVLGCIYMLIAFACDLAVAAMSSKLGQWFSNNAKFNLYQDRMSGSILFSLGSYIGLKELLK